MKQFRWKESRLDQLWSTLASHSKGVIIEAVLLDERDRANDESNLTLSKELDYRIKELNKQGVK